MNKKEIAKLNFNIHITKDDSTIDLCISNLISLCGTCGNADDFSVMMNYYFFVFFVEYVCISCEQTNHHYPHCSCDILCIIPKACDILILLYNGKGMRDIQGKFQHI